MRELRSRVAATLVAAVAAVAASVPAGATTIQLIDDAKLVDRSPLVVVGTIESKSTPILERPATEWTVSVERVLKGFLGEGRIVLRVPGGLAPNGLANFIYGTPPFAPGRRAMLFLSPVADGTYRLADFPQGAFLSATTPRRSYAFRDFSQVTVRPGSGRTGAREPYRDFERFAEWIADRAGGAGRSTDYLVNPGRTELKTVVQRFTLLSSSGIPIRWTVFDSGGSAPWFSTTPGIPGLSGGGANEVKKAQAVWNNEATTPVRYTYAGTTTNTIGLTDPDNFNTVVWNDPRDEMPGEFFCSSGGTLAHASPWYDPDRTVTFNGKTFYPAVHGDVVFNNGIECKDDGSRNFSTFITYVAAHELGHTLGLGHSSNSDDEPNSVLRNALMYKSAKSRPTTVVLTSDDIAGLQTLYRVGGPTGGGGGGGGGSTGSTGCPSGTPANTLCLLKGRFRVTGTWTNQFNNTNGTAIPIVNTDLSGFFYFGDKSNVELIIKILDFGSEIKVFYSQLTNLQFTLTVTDSTTGRAKSYSNTPGDCGAIDGNFAAAISAESAEPEGMQSAPENATASCTATTNTLCLLSKRFAIDVSWRNQFNGTSGVGKQKTLSNLTGAFSFDNAANLEILIKTLDFGGRVLVIYGSLSNFEYTIRVTDTTTGVSKEYKNAAGQFCGGLDQNAF